MNKTITTEEACTHEPLVDTGAGYYHCPACNQGWSYQEWEIKNSKPNLMNKTIEESVTSTNTQVRTVCAKELRGEAGCKEVCDECKRKMQEAAVSTEAEGWRKQELISNEGWKVKLQFSPTVPKAVQDKFLEVIADYLLLTPPTVTK